MSAGWGVCVRGGECARGVWGEGGGCARGGV